jgi:hypothetical protein
MALIGSSLRIPEARVTKNDGQSATAQSEFLLHGALFEDTRRAVGAAKDAYPQYQEHLPPCIVRGGSSNALNGQKADVRPHRIIGNPVVQRTV